MDAKMREYIEKLNPSELDELIAELQDLRKEKEDPKRRFFWNRATELLRELGISCTSRGYDYIRYAIVEAAENFAPNIGMHTQVYPNVAKYFGVKPEAVERLIRSNIEKCCNNPNMYRKMHEYFGSVISSQKGKPTNRQFIITVARRLNEEWEAYYIL